MVRRVSAETLEQRRLLRMEFGWDSAWHPRYQRWPSGMLGEAADAAKDLLAVLLAIAPREVEKGLAGNFRPLYWQKGDEPVARSYKNASPSDPSYRVVVQFQAAACPFAATDARDLVEHRGALLAFDGELKAFPLPGSMTVENARIRQQATARQDPGFPFVRLKLRLPKVSFEGAKTWAADHNLALAYLYRVDSGYEAFDERVGHLVRIRHAVLRMARMYDKDLDQSFECPSGRLLEVFVPFLATGHTQRLRVCRARSFDIDATEWKRASKTIADVLNVLLGAGYRVWRPYRLRIGKITDEGFYEYILQWTGPALLTTCGGLPRVGGMLVFPAMTAYSMVYGFATEPSAPLEHGFQRRQIEPGDLPPRGLKVQMELDVRSRRRQAAWELHRSLAVYRVWVSSRTYQPGTQLLSRAPDDYDSRPFRVLDLEIQRANLTGRPPAKPLELRLVVPVLDLGEVEAMHERSRNRG